MSEEITFNNKTKNIRISGESGSPQNNLRYELYTEGFRRIEKGLEEGNYFEVVCLCDSIINDRLTSLIQTIKHKEGIDFTYMSVGNVIKTLFRTLRDDQIVISKEFRELIIEVEQKWLPKRNFVSHSFVVVTNSTVSKSMEDRLNTLKECGIEGSQYCRKITNETDKFIRKFKKEN